MEEPGYKKNFWNHQRTQLFLLLITDQLRISWETQQLSFFTRILILLNAQFPNNNLTVSELNTKFNFFKRVYKYDKVKNSNSPKWPHFKIMKEIMEYLSDDDDPEVVLDEPSSSDQPKRVFKWTVQATNTLLNIIEEKAGEQNKEDFWLIVAEKFNSEYPEAAKHELTAKDLDDRYWNLKRYYVLKKRLASVDLPTNWRYFDQFNRILKLATRKVKETRKCRVCYEDVRNFNKFQDEIETGSGVNIKIAEAFTFVTKFKRTNSKYAALCMSCTNSLMFVYDFLAKAMESKVKFDQMVTEPVGFVKNVWTFQKTDLFLHMIKRRLGRFNANVWADIHQEFKYHFPKSTMEPSELRRKFQIFKEIYAYYKTNVRKKLPKWPHFDRMKEIIEHFEEGTDPKPNLNSEEYMTMVQSNHGFNSVNNSVDRNCRVCFETPKRKKHFFDKIKTGSEVISMEDAFSFVTKYYLNESELAIFCLSCTNSLMFVSDFLKKAKETKMKFEKTIRTAEKDEQPAIIEVDEEPMTIAVEEAEVLNHNDVIPVNVKNNLEVLGTDNEGGQSTQQQSMVLLKRISKYRCGQCNRSFINKAMLLKHIKIVHRFTENECPICTKSFDTSFNLHQHTSKSHRPGRDFNCEICGETFTYKDSLQKLPAHMMLHII